MSRLRIAVHDFVGHTFPVQLSRELARSGYDVLHLYFAGFQGPKGSLVRSPGDPESFSIRPIVLEGAYPKYNYARRFFVDRRFCGMCTDELARFQPDVLISGNASPTIQKRLLKYCKRNSIGFVYWVQDWYGIAAKNIFAQKLGPLGRMFGSYILLQEQQTARDSDGLVLISQDFLNVLPERSAANAAVIENWAPLDKLPLRPKSNPWSLHHGLADKRVFLYSGTLGLKHNPELLVQLALKCREAPDVVVVVISEGLGREYLEARKSELSLDNLGLFDFQPFEVLPDVVASGDVLIAIIEKEAGVFSVPSKVLTYLCAQRPLLLAVPASNLAARIVSDNAAGLVVDPSDMAGFLAAAMKLIANIETAAEMGRMGRNYALRTFDIKQIASRFESVLHAAAKTRRASVTPGNPLI